LLLNSSTNQTEESLNWTENINNKWFTLIQRSRKGCQSLALPAFTFLLFTLRWRAVWRPVAIYLNSCFSPHPCSYSIALLACNLLTCRTSQHHRPVAAANFVARWISRDGLTRGAWSSCVVTYLEFHDRAIPRPWTSSKEKWDVLPKYSNSMDCVYQLPGLPPSPNVHYRVNKPFHCEILSRSRYSPQHTLEVCLSLEARDQLYRSYIKAEEVIFCVLYLWKRILSGPRQLSLRWRNTGRVRSEHACFLKAFFATSHASVTWI
jgi:hypothetical protein